MDADDPPSTENSINESPEQSTSGLQKVHDVETPLTTDILQQRKKPLSPVKILERHSNEDVLRSPAPKKQRTHPVASPDSPVKNYQRLYQEMKRKVKMLIDSNVIELENKQTEVDKLLDQASEMKAREEADRAQLVLLQEDNDNKAKVIGSLKIQNKHLIEERDALIKKHAKTDCPEGGSKPTPITATIETQTDSSSFSMMRRSSEEFIRLKPPNKKQGKNKKQNNRNITDIDNLMCEFNGCGGTNVDLIKCNGCEKWICEECNDVPVARLKPIMNKCRTVFLYCKNCAEILPTINSTAPLHSESANILNSIKTIIVNKVAELESKIENTIESKIGAKLEAVTQMSENIKLNNESPNVEPSYAEKVKELPAQMRKIIQEARNEEKIEGIEIKRRSRNIIIHNSEEWGDNDAAIKEADEPYIKEILDYIKVKIDVESITRLGKPNERKKRPIKVVLRTEADRDKVMANLRFLKGSEFKFGNISVTKDYTESERNLIKGFVEKAKQKEFQKPGRVYKVRGDPSDSKNGLRIISFEKR